jgi:acyl carrier protein
MNPIHMSDTELNRQKTVALILDCIADIPGAENVANDGSSDQLPLLGPGSTLDSMGLVTLIVDVEQRLADEYDVSVTLASENAMSRRQSPFRTVGALADYISELTVDSGSHA